MSGASHPDPFRVYVSAALVFRGEVEAVRRIFEIVEEASGRNRVKLIYQKVSGSPLRIVEGNGP